MRRFPEPGQVHLHAADIDVSVKQVERLSALLCRAEHARARRFISPAHGRRFAAARGILRLVLGQYLETRPEKVVLGAGAGGKPRIVSPEGAGCLCFNLSHSGGKVLIGVTAARRIGVDLEAVDHGKNPLRLAARFFYPQEAEALARAPESKQAGIFFRYWTAKEAYLKSVGDGLGRLGDVRILPDNRGECFIVDRGVSVCDSWTVREVHVSEGYAAAVAVEGRISPEKISVYNRSLINGRGALL